MAKLASEMENREYDAAGAIADLWAYRRSWLQGRPRLADVAPAETNETAGRG
ncbi:hypothetical protein ABW21_db0209749 [Orbilia brochopaga]|nr:hypothetical protein ABW21_db0209749 [Drechslerella brochopaga]